MNTLIKAGITLSLLLITGISFGQTPTVPKAQMSKDIKRSESSKKKSETPGNVQEKPAPSVMPAKKQAPKTKNTETTK